MVIFHCTLYKRGYLQKWKSYESSQMICSVSVSHSAQFPHQELEEQNRGSVIPLTLESEASAHRRPLPSSVHTVPSPRDCAPDCQSHLPPSSCSTATTQSETLLPRLSRELSTRSSRSSLGLSDSRTSCCHSEPPEDQLVPVL